MTTPLDIITRALQTINQIGEGEAPTAVQANDGLVYFNDLVDSLSNQGLMVFEESRSALTLTGAASYTIGAGGNLNITRPVAIHSAFYTSGGIDNPVDVITVDEFDGIMQKSATSTMPLCVYVNYSSPLMTAYVYPVASSGSITFICQNRIQSTASLSTTLALPMGYERMLRFALANEMQTEYGIANQLVAQMATESIAQIKRVNHKTKKLNVTGYRRPNILTGY